MDRTPFGDLEKSLPLAIIKVPIEFDLTIDAVKEPLVRLTVRAILGMNPRVLKAHDDAPQRPSLSLGIHSKSHGCAGAQTRNQEFVRRRACVGSERRGFVSAPTMLSRDNVLG